MIDLLQLENYRSVWFYALSTIAQSCAAIIAVGATFVVYKLQSLEPAISGFRSVVQVVLRAHAQHRPKRDTDLLQYFSVYFENIVVDPEVLRVCDDLYPGLGNNIPSEQRIINFQEIRDNLAHNLQVKTRILAGMRNAVIFLSISMCGAIAALPLVGDRLFQYPWLLWVGTAWSLFSILYTVYVVYRIAVAKIYSF